MHPVTQTVINFAGTSYDNPRKKNAFTPEENDILKLPDAQ